MTLAKSVGALALVAVAGRNNPKSGKSSTGEITRIQSPDNVAFDLASLRHSFASDLISSFGAAP
jgi:hypothetical protein